MKPHRLLQILSLLVIQTISFSQTKVDAISNKAIVVTNINPDITRLLNGSIYGSVFCDGCTDTIDHHLYTLRAYQVSRLVPNGQIWLGEKIGDAIFEYNTIIIGWYYKIDNIPSGKKIVLVFCRTGIGNTQKGATPSITRGAIISEEKDPTTCISTNLNSVIINYNFTPTHDRYHNNIGVGK